MVSKAVLGPTMLAPSVGLPGFVFAKTPREGRRLHVHVTSYCLVSDASHPKGLHDGRRPRMVSVLVHVRCRDTDGIAVAPAAPSLGSSSDAAPLLREVWWHMGLLYESPLRPTYLSMSAVHKELDPMTGECRRVLLEVASMYPVYEYVGLSTLDLSSPIDVCFTSWKTMSCD